MGQPVGKVSTSGPSSTPIAEDAGKTTVMEDESIHDVAKRLGVSRHDLLEANPGLSRKTITAGMQLVIPAGKGKVEEAHKEEDVSSAGGGSSLKGEVDMKGQAVAAELQSGVGGGQVEAATKGFKPGSKDKDVLEFQKDLNAWRKANGQGPIKETGVYDKETKEAVQDYQQSIGAGALKGTADASTRDLLALENNPNFKALDQQTQKEIQGLLRSWSGEPKQREALMKMVTDDNFKKLDYGEQSAFLRKLISDPKFSGYLPSVMKDYLELKNDPNFQKLDPEVREGYTRLFLTPSEEQRASIRKLVTDNDFGKLSPEIQKRIGGQLAKGDALFAKKMTEFIANGPFSKMTEKNQSEVLDAIDKYTSDLFVAKLIGLSRGELRRLDNDDVERLKDQAMKEFAKEFGVTL